MLNHILRQTVQSRISADQHGNPLPGRAPRGNLLQECGDIGLDEDSLRGAIGEQFHEAFAAHEDVGPGDRLPRGLGDIQGRARPAADDREFGRIHCHGEKSPSVPRHSPGHVDQEHGHGQALGNSAGYRRVAPAWPVPSASAVLSGGGSAAKTPSAVVLSGAGCPRTSGHTRLK